MDEQRFALLNYAVTQLARLSGARVYLDGTHSRWVEVGDASDRLVRAGVLRTAGFFLNVSNYQPTDELVRYGERVSDCIAFGAQATGDLRTQRFKQCSAQQTHAPIGADRVHFVIDTGRNGRGAWTPPADRYSDPQAWCNPPGRGLGDRPTLRTSHALLDAKLWIKVPGESDGECTRGLAGPNDPERGVIDPPAGRWFKEQAAELIAFATPPIS